MPREFLETPAAHGIFFALVSLIMYAFDQRPRNVRRNTPRLFLHPFDRGCARPALDEFGVFCYPLYDTMNYSATMRLDAQGAA
jgi:hypothetical protein